MINIKMGNSGVSLSCIVCAEGDKFCVTLDGSDFRTMPCGFGDTVMDAIDDFKNEVRTVTLRGTRQ
tara:strand:+ start:841 stop:1038 length:198 start_codon:yes stop_codon:yes gene_type:complete